MWPVREVQVFLPEHLHASEDTHFLVIRCSQCRWTAWFSAVGASLEELQRAVQEHRACPTRTVTRSKNMGDAGGRRPLTPPEP